MALIPGLTRLDYTAIHLGYPLQFPVYDGKGQLLLNKGYVVKDRAQLDALIRRGIYQKKTPQKTGGSGGVQSGAEAPKATLNAFIDFDELLEQLQAVSHLIINEQPEANKRTRLLVSRIEQFCDQNAEACLARIHRELSGDFHHKVIYYAWLCCLVSRRLGLPPQRQKRLIAAALTANIALLSFQEKLHHSRVTLSPEQREIIDKHPQLSATALRKAGITDDHWLKIVETHHERASASSDERILTESLLLGCCEHYIAMIVGRASREPKTVTEAFEWLLKSPAPAEKRILEAFQAELSAYPPGTFVRLASEEIALVVSRDPENRYPKVKAIISARGAPLTAPMTRHTEDPDYAVREVVKPKNVPNINNTLIWKN